MIRTVKGLQRAIERGKEATLKVYDIMPNSFAEGGAYLNLGEGRYAGVGAETWKQIRQQIVDASTGERCSSLSQFSKYYQ
ncbi:MAG: hypothetical protein ACOYJ1_05505 [Peptococcales bacterium]|jgi:hypothetical protein